MGESQPSPGPRPDLFELLADRASRKTEHEGEIQALLRAQERHREELEEAKLESARLQSEVERTRLQAAAREEEHAQHVAILQGRLEEEARTAARALAAARAELAAQRAEAAEALADARRAREDLESQFRAAREQADEAESRRLGEEQTSALLQEQLEGARRELAEAQREGEADRVRIAELEAAQQSAGALAGPGSEAEAALARTLRARLAAAEGAAAQIPALREAARSAPVLHERALAAEEQVVRLEALLAAADERGAAGLVAQQRLGRWRAALADAAEALGCAGAGDDVKRDGEDDADEEPERVIALLRSQQAELLALRERGAERARGGRAARAAEAAAAARLASLDAAAASDASRARQAREAVGRLERRVALLLRERDGLRAVLSSYDAEYEAGADAAADAKQARILELEGAVQRLHEHVAALESERAGATGDGRAAGPRPTRAAEAEALAARLQAEGEALADLVDSLQRRVARGEYDPATTRVLRLKRSPEAEAAQAQRDARVSELESQNAALAAAVSRLEEELAGAQARASPGAALGSPSPRAASSTGLAVRAAELEAEVATLRRRAAELQKASDRLQQVFRRQITLFREAVYLLLGYRVEMEAEPRGGVRARLTLHPQHEDERAVLRFDLLRAGGVALVPTELSTTRLAREVETFIDRFRSVPAFTANLTLENFQRQTQS
ncbi:hypothetical protein QBZ16_004846 [Prototheca wickerhamii]|uniref:Spindle assembly checkpoint component MAD1 n=1 Tax=Prototheca wickerhamii TaxID=3111 RepID=A0AAD9IJA5_PROWI|nr:hypothetical protein QBZ16_004846 [Prototheca wickerhamii]